MHEPTALVDTPLTRGTAATVIETRDAMGNRCIENLEALLLKGQNPPHRAA